MIVKPNALVQAGAVIATAVASVAVAPAPASAQTGQQVRYVVSATGELTANIYYVSADPPDRAAANSPEFMPLFRGVVGPGSPWVRETTLRDPQQWAFVSATGGSRVDPGLKCEIVVDGQTVVSQQGGSGVECALRSW
ncbi:hypothetical protein V4U86_15515 [Mycobacterium sp. AMU20-3851]|uniref:hypothetical protein n=1 Tax=Mycobacterium sp. AMU20-3851 TaxID=3122055 RepID=UPI0037552EEC